VYNFVNPVRRDVVSAGLAGDNVTIRFETNNAGPWILHWFVFSIFRSEYYISTLISAGLATLTGT
jgi:hypothetical protein